MDKLYLALLTIAAVVLLYDAFNGAVRSKTRTVAIQLLPLALFFWILVPWFQVANRVF
jgi:hypothetical protein